MKDNDMVKNFLKKRNMIVLFGISLLCASLYAVVPRIFLPKPVIYAVTPDAIMVNSNFNSNKSITLEGDKFNHLVAIYINGIWEPECNIISQMEDTIQIALPPQYYCEQNELDIQVQTKINSDLFGMSNKMKFTVLSDADIERPKITSVTPNILNLEQGIFQEITLEGENFNENSVVTIDDIAVETAYADHILTVSIPFWDYYKENEIGLNVVQYYDGYATSVKSPLLYLKVDPYITDTVDEEEALRQNQQLMTAYLRALKKDDYIVIFSVKDESSYAMTDEITAELRNLGLKENLKEAGAHNSYIAVLDGLSLIHEELGKDALNYDNTLNELSLHVESANYYAGSLSVIQIQGADYSVNGRGLNIVVYSKSAGRVIDCVSFDTFEGLSLIKS